MLYRLGFDTAQNFTETCLESAKLVNPTEDQYFAAIKIVQQFPDQTVTIVDALTAIISKQLNIPVWTYDYHFDIMRVSVWR